MQKIIIHTLRWWITSCFASVFANTDASRLLIKTAPDTLYSLSIFYGEDIHKSWEELFPSIQTGTPAFQLTFQQPVFSYFKDTPKRAALFQAAMNTWGQVWYLHLGSHLGSGLVFGYF